ncbi:MAG: hypothetical protein M3N53_08815 [Actinomycetota bacterium]|nr:hypothetical protein [Actinomycetota bacterium]
MSSRRYPEKVAVYAVIRYEADAKSLDFRVTVKEVLPTKEEAEREVERLNALTTDDAVTYFCQSSRYYPRGRGVLKVVDGE